MSVPISVVDAFTDTAFRGNPAAVCRLEVWPHDDTWLQQVARELHLSETAFVVPRRSAGEYDLRWFTPTVEIELCGHATLATTHLLGGAPTFWTRSGALACRRHEDGLVEMDFPAMPVTPIASDVALARALRTSDIYTVGRSRYDVLVELGDAAAVRNLRPDIEAIEALDVRGLCVTAPGDREGIDFVSRFFAPSSGVPEDPVTGSAHCTLAPFWAERTGRATLVGEQLSTRGGTVQVRVDGDRVRLGGRAVTIWEGTLLAGPPN